MLRLAKNKMPKFFHTLSKLNPANILHITDTEGHSQFLTDSVKNSQIVSIGAHGRLDFKSKISNPYFIFGGDLTDRGVGDIELTEQLLDFKRRHPERVMLLVGNREASKSRFHIELEPKHIRERLLKGTVPFWLSAVPHKVPLDYVKTYMSEHHRESHQDIEAFISGLSITTCQLIYLKWMLTETLGCPHTFYYHAQQLAKQRQCPHSEISDEEVLQSFITLTSPNGLMGEFLKQTQIAAIIPNTGVLAIHGGLTLANIGRLPSMQRDEPFIKDAHAWIEQFNAWYKSEVTLWSQIDPAEIPLCLQPARTALDTFSIRIPSEYRSIVTASMLDEERRFTDVPTLISDYLIQNGIYLVLTGHQPCGDHPALLKSQNNRVLFINGDTGYANVRANEVHNTRGKTSHTLEILAEPQNAIVSIDAKISSKQHIKTCLNITPDAIEGHGAIGRMLPNHELVQYQLTDGNYRTIHQHGFRVDYKTRSPQEIEELLQKKCEPLMPAFS